MMKKLTITVSEEVYNGLHAKIGQGKISRFIDSLARPHVVETELEDGYHAMAQDSDRETQAEDWLSGLMNETW